MKALHRLRYVFIIVIELLPWESAGVLSPLRCPAVLCFCVCVHSVMGPASWSSRHSFSESSLPIAHFFVTESSVHLSVVKVEQAFPVSCPETSAASSRPSFFIGLGRRPARWRVGEQHLILPGLLLLISGFAFALGYAFQLKVRPHGGNEPQECPEPASGFHAVIESSASSPGLGTLAGQGAWLTPVCAAGTPSNHRRMAADQALWHGGRSVCLAHGIVKNLCFKLLTFGDYSRSASN